MSFVLRAFFATALLAAALGGASTPAAQPSPSVPPSPPDIERRSDTVDFAASGKIEIDNRTGRITVTTWDRPQVGYEVALTPSEGDSVVATDLDIDRSEGELSFGHDHSWSIRIPGLLTISPDGTGEPVGHFWVIMPETADLEIDDHASTIEVSNVQGTVNIDTHSGPVTVENVGGPLRLETFSGRATASGLRREADLETHSGRVTAAFEQFTTPSTAETHSGDLRFYLPAKTGFTLRTDADSSNIAIAPAFGAPSRDEEEWRFNGGGPELSVETFSGTIELRPSAARPSTP